MFLLWLEKHRGETLVEFVDFGSVFGRVFQLLSEANPLAVFLIKDALALLVEKFAITQALQLISMDPLLARGTCSLCRQHMLQPRFLDQVPVELLAEVSRVDFSLPPDIDNFENLELLLSVDQALVLLENCRERLF